MHVEAKGTAIFKIEETEELVEVHADTLDWECDSDGERKMGPEYVHTAEYEVGGLTVIWQIWEYPEGVENHKETTVPSGLTKVSDIKYWLAHDPEPDDQE